MMRKRLFAEFVGTATLVATVVGSGIMVRIQQACRDRKQ